MPNRICVCLVVEDGEVDRKRLCRMLLRHCPLASPIAVKNLAEAREALATYDVDLIFLDNVLPDGSGVDFAAELARKPATRDLPIIMVSDFPTPFIYAKLGEMRDCEVWNKDNLRINAVQIAVEKHVVMHA